jgi:hypothetical protein
VKIGIDIGNVIIGGGGEDTFFTDDFLKTPEVAGALYSIGRLKDDGHELHLISKCGPSVEYKSMIWLSSKAYFMSILNEHRVHFVRKRHLKAPMALALELDIFIDDRLDIIDSMEQIVPNRILFIDWEHTNRELQAIFDKAAEG